MHTVVVRSTVPPRTTEDLVRPLLEDASGKAEGVGFCLASNPEFLPPLIALGDTRLFTLPIGMLFLQGQFAIGEMQGGRCGHGNGRRTGQDGGQQNGIDYLQYMLSSTLRRR